MKRPSAGDWKRDKAENVALLRIRISASERRRTKRAVILCCSMTKFHAMLAFPFPSKQDMSYLFLLFFIFFPFLFYWELANHVSPLISPEQERRRQTFFWKLPTLSSICCAVAWKCLTCPALQAVCVTRQFRLEFDWFGLQKADSDVFWSARELLVPSFNFILLICKNVPLRIKNCYFFLQNFILVRVEKPLKQHLGNKSKQPKQ